MLPVRLGMLNAQGAAGSRRLRAHPQRPRRDDQLPHGEVACRTSSCRPTCAASSGRSTRRCSRAQAKREDYRVVWTEYFWDMAWCDPCAADPLSRRGAARRRRLLARRRRPADRRRAGRPRSGRAPERRRAAGNAHATAPALHAARRCPRTSMFQETQDRQNFQARYVLRHPWQGDANACAAGEELFRRSREAPGTRSADTRQSDRVGPERHSEPHEHAAGRRRRNGGSGCGNDRDASRAGAIQCPRSHVAGLASGLPRDAGLFQILFLAALLTIGVLLRDFSLQPLQIALAFAAGLATQAFWLRAARPASRRASSRRS